MNSKTLHLLVIFAVTQFISSAPVPSQETNERKAKNLAFYDYIQPEVIDYNNYEADNDDYLTLGLEDNDLSRTLPGSRRVKPRPQPYNSPIYYIRLPPQPYMFIPGLGYVSQPPQNPMNQFVNLPVSFISNGKPNSIYQWSSGLEPFPTVPEPIQPVQTIPTKPTTKPTKKPLPDSNIHRLPGQYTFNGKPEDIFVLRDSYNSLYGDALQNFYP